MEVLAFTTIIVLTLTLVSLGKTMGRNCRTGGEFDEYSIALSGVALAILLQLLLIIRSMF